MKAYKSNISLPQFVEVFKYTGKNFNELKEFINFEIKKITYKHNYQNTVVIHLENKIECIYNESTGNADLIFDIRTLSIQYGEFVVKNEYGELEILKPSIFHLEYRELNPNVQKPLIKAQELVKLLRELCFDEKTNTIDLSNLDFSMYKCHVDTSYMKVDGGLNQSYQVVNGRLLQSHQIVEKDLVQNYCKVKKDIFQNNHFVDRNLYQDGQYVKFHLSQNFQAVGWNLEQDHQRVGKDLEEGNNEVGKGLYE